MSKSELWQVVLRRSEPFRLLGLVLGLVVLGLVLSDWQGQVFSNLQPYVPRTARTGRVVFVMVDSMTDTLAEDEMSFSSLARLRPSSAWGRMEGCLPASTVPCTRTMLEGSAAGYAAGLRNFMPTRAPDSSFAVIAARHGLRLAAASDHTFNRLCEGLGGPRLDYSHPAVPLFTWDEAAAEKVPVWLSERQGDVIFAHLIDLDKASHVYGPGTDPYVEQVRQADAAIAAIVARLDALDNVIVAGDHGHDEHGNHTPNPGYLAHGPLFAAGRVDIKQETMALFLSLAAGTPLPSSYAGEVPQKQLTATFGGSENERARVERSVRDHIQSARIRSRQAALVFILAAWAVAAALVFAFVRTLRSRSVVVLAAAAALAVNFALGYGWAPELRAFFWVGPPVNLLHYALFCSLCVAPVAVASRKRLSLGWGPSLGLGLLMLPFVSHLPSDDYFSTTVSLSRWFVLALVLLLGAEVTAADPSRYRSARVAIALALGAMVMSFASGSTPGGRGVEILAALVGGLAFVEWSAGFGPAAAKVTFVAALLAVFFRVTDFGGHAALGMMLVLGAAVQAARSIEGVEPSAELRRVVVLAAALLLAFWFSLGSMRFERVGYAFAFKLMQPSTNEAAVAMRAAPLTALKYLALPATLFWAMRTTLSSQVASRVTKLLIGRALLVAAWTAGVLYRGGSRYTELGIEEAALTAALCCFTILAWAATLVRRVQPVPPTPLVTPSPAAPALPPAPGV